MDKIKARNKKNLKAEDLSVYNLINKPERKFENFLIIAGVISYYGLDKLIYLSGTMNDFTYGQTLKT